MFRESYNHFVGNKDNWRKRFPRWNVWRRWAAAAARRGVVARGDRPNVAQNVAVAVRGDRPNVAVRGDRPNVAVRGDRPNVAVRGGRGSAADRAGPSAVPNVDQADLP